MSRIVLCDRCHEQQDLHEIEAERAEGWVIDSAPHYLDLCPACADQYALDSEHSLDIA